MDFLTELESMAIKTMMSSGGKSYSNSLSQKPTHRWKTTTRTFPAPESQMSFVTQLNQTSRPRDTNARHPETHSHGLNNVTCQGNVTIMDHPSFSLPVPYVH